MGRSRFVVLFLLVLNLFTHALAEQIFTANAGGSFGRSSHEPKYKIEYHPADSPYHPVDDDQESLTISHKNGQKFLCYLPRVEKAKAGKSISQKNISTMIIEMDRRVKLKTPDELLEVLKEECLYRQEGWWSYEFCYHKQLRQFHVEDDKAVQEFVLGVYDAEATAAFNQNHSDVSILKDPRSKDASQRYHAHQYTNGTICDLTGQPRATEVRFVCSEPRVMISSITELSTCKYALTIQSPMLCKHPMFKEERPIWHTINCNELSNVTEDKEVEEEGIKDNQPSVVADIKLLANSDAEENAW
ncbi:hypothetical protein Syun_025579 [Stephania yunnanensis]|uniref:Protein OS-9 homolog n=1 Tax=Stephania yunnanensis TaxID=152371 RepID=A0AAP0HV83_9MAGN